MDSASTHTRSEDVPATGVLPFSGELKRKGLHLLALVVPLCMYFFGKTVSLWILIPIACFGVFGDVLRVRHAGFRAFIQQWFGFMMRPREWPPLGGSVLLNGATWVFLAATLTLVIFPVEIAAPAFAMFMLADAAAALIGRRFGRTHWWGGSRRTVEGSAAFFLTGCVALVLFGLGPWWLVGLVAIAGAAAEAVPKPFNDNLRVPLVAGTVMACCFHFILHQPVALF